MNSGLTCDVVEHLGILPLSSFIPDHPSLVSITRDDAWHTGLVTDPWLWRDRFAGEGVAAYGRFLASKPVLISGQLFPLIQCVLSPNEKVTRVDDVGLGGPLWSPVGRGYGPFIDEPISSDNPRRATIKASHPSTQPPSPLQNPR